MSEQEWAGVYRDIVTPFTCSCTWLGILGGAVGGLFLLSIIEYFLRSL
jgi:cell division protein FtsX